MTEAANLLRILPPCWGVSSDSATPCSAPCNGQLPYLGRSTRVRSRDRRCAIRVSDSELESHVFHAQSHSRVPFCDLCTPAPHPPRVRARACHVMRRRRDKVREWTFPDGVARSEGVGELRLVTSGPHPPKPASGVAGMSQRRDPSDSGRWIGTVAECHSCETQSETAQVVAVTRTPPAPHLSLRRPS